VGWSVAVGSTDVVIGGVRVMVGVTGNEVGVDAGNVLVEGTGICVAAGRPPQAETSSVTHSRQTRSLYMLDLLNF
jgi:hypothetical protein